MKPESDKQEKPFMIKRGRKSISYMLKRCFYLELPVFEEEEQLEEFDLLENELTEVKKERDTFKEHLIRLKAEFENYRKRSDREKKDITERANEKLICELLPIFDQFDLALKSTGNLSDEDFFVKGVRMIYDNIFAMLAAQGLVKIDALGKIFDPHFHEAIATEPSETAKENEIILVLREGFQYKNRVIRPSLVKVAKN